MMKKPTTMQSTDLLLAYCSFDRHVWQEALSKKKNRKEKLLKAQAVASHATWTLYSLLDEGLIDLQALPPEHQERIERLYTKARAFFDQEGKA